MKEKNCFAPRVKCLEKEFRKLRKKEFKNHANAYKDAQKMHFGDDAEIKEEINEKERMIWEEAGLDMEQLRKIDEVQWQKAKAHLEKSKAILKNREIDPDERAREQLIWVSRNNEFGAQTIPMIGADRIEFRPVPAPPDWGGDEQVGATSHSWGNSFWFQPEGPSTLKVSHQSHEHYCWLPDFDYQIKSVDYWFYFTPLENGKYWILCNLPYDGFYVLHAFDKLWNCRYASVSARAYLKIYQELWYPTHTKLILQESGKWIHKVSPLNGQVSFDFHQNLNKSPVWIKLSFKISAYTQYNSTYAEMNFADGASHHIGPPTLMAAKIGSYSI
jgi:hypothetical protein